MRLRRGRERAATGMVLLEGRRLVRAARDAGVELEALYVTDPADVLAHGVAHASVVPDDLLLTMATTQNPQGLVAVARWRPATTLPGGAARVLVLAGVSDPGNAGTLVRSAAAFGWDAVVLARGSCDPTNPKALRAGAGATFATTVVAGVDAGDVAGALGADGFTTIGAATRGGTAPEQVDVTGRIALFVGSEAHGLDPAVAELLSTEVTVPVAAGVDSLNAAAAGAVLTYALARRG
ncbi:MAG: RNA methyltransferase [Acidimicrobiia bacterium]|nr:RNA methyltransferase [Acidimicrobiia bacterium]